MFGNILNSLRGSLELLPPLISQLIKCQNTFSATAYRGHGQTKRQDKDEAN